MKFKSLLAAVLLLAAQAASAGPFDYSCTDCPQLIPPAGTSGTTISTITVTDSGTIADLSIFIDAFHTFSGDLEISLTHGATTVVLQDNVGGSVDYAPTLYGPLAEFVGDDINGDWILTINDTLNLDSGQLVTWNIFGNADMATGAPEPGILILMGLGLAGLGFARRRS